VALYAEMQQLERDGYNASPGNLDLAIHSFMATYDRWPSRPDSQLLDCVTALEAILGAESELSFKLAFRVASLLASDDAERGTLLETMKGFYDTRSALVHGGRLKQKHESWLAKVNDLRALVRTLLRAFVRFATRGGHGHGYSKTAFRDHLDATLVNATEREKLRRALGLSEDE
jgi:hypothetical protein